MEASTTQALVVGHEQVYGQAHEHSAPSDKDIEGAIPIAEGSDPSSDAPTIDAPRELRGSGGPPAAGIGLEC